MLAIATIPSAIFASAAGLRHHSEVSQLPA
jgi:hypothetical protein